MWGNGLWCGVALQVKVMMWRGWQAGSLRVAGQPSQWSFLCTAGTVMRRCTPAHTPTLALGSTFLSLITHTPCGAARPYTTVSTTPGEAAPPPPAARPSSLTGRQAGLSCGRFRSCRSVTRNDKFLLFLYIYFLGDLGFHQKMVFTKNGFHQKYAWLLLAEFFDNVCFTLMHIQRCLLWILHS